MAPGPLLPMLQAFIVCYGKQVDEKINAMQGAATMSVGPSRDRTGTWIRMGSAKPSRKSSTELAKRFVSVKMRMGTFLHGSSGQHAAPLDMLKDLSVLYRTGTEGALYRKKKSIFLKQ